MSSLRSVLVLAVLLAAALGGTVSARSPVRIEVLGTRADLVSAGDVLVRVRGASSLTVNGKRQVLHGNLALVTGLRAGENDLIAPGARLTVTNHPRGGPVFSGSQVQPWICTTAVNGLGAPRDAQCNGRTTYSYRYKSSLTGTFFAYDPSHPVRTVATTTTDQGRRVPYVVRLEKGTLNRGIYSVAVLFDPAKPFTPWQPQRGWDRKVLYLFGQGCKPGRTQATPIDVLDDMALRRGYAVASATTSTMGNVCNPTVAAETVAMVKERITETLGPIRFTMGDGCSGGSESQNTIADNYPGLLNGVRPTCTFPDPWTPAITTKSDCDLLEAYFSSVPLLWPVPTQRAAVLGFPSELPCTAAPPAKGISAEDWDPTTGCGDDSASWMYDPATRPRGARCTLQDANAPIVGLRKDGKANGILDDVGLEWGLHAAVSGAISVEQFVDLNQQVGGWTIDHQHQRERTGADLAGVRRMYLAGQLITGRNVGRIPSIDARTDDTMDLHGNVYRDALRARVLKSVGGTASQVFWTEPARLPSGIPTPQTAAKTFDVMDSWLSTGHRPAQAHDACVAAGVDLMSAAPCDTVASHEQLARIVAGAPVTADVLKCQLASLSRSAHAAKGLVFTDAQWRRMQTAFPTGVCDFAKPGVGERAPLGDWLSYSSGTPVPLGPAPASVPTALPLSGPSGSLPATGLRSLLPVVGLCLLTLALSGRGGGRSRRRARSRWV